MVWFKNRKTIIKPLKTILKISDKQSQDYAVHVIKTLSIDKQMQITIEPETRTTQNNKAQWPILNAFAEQLLWPVNGAMTRLTGEEWKHILTAAYRQEMARVAQGLDGGMVLLGHRTREFKKSEWSDWMEFLQSVAADRSIKIPLSKSQAAVYE